MLTIKDIRANCPELSETEVDDSWQIPDSDIQSALDDAIVIVGTITGLTDLTIISFLQKYLARHLAVLALRDVIGVRVPNLSASYRTIEADLGLDQTVHGQQFKAIVSKYTSDFKSPEELAKTPQHFLKFFS